MILCSKESWFLINSPFILSHFLIFSTKHRKNEDTRNTIGKEPWFQPTKHACVSCDICSICGHCRISNIGFLVDKEAWFFAISYSIPCIFIFSMFGWKNQKMWENEKGIDKKPWFFTFSKESWFLTNSLYLSH